MSYTGEQLKTLLNQSVLKADHEFEAPPVCLQIAGEFGNQTFATLGNFSTLLARPKVGKTTFTAIAVTSLLNENPISKFIPTIPGNNKKILWIDTEQGKPECIKIIRFISEQVTGDKMQHPENLYYLSLRPFNYQQRIELTEFALRTLNDVFFVVIDGIRDFVSSINDEKEASFIADKLLKWSQEKNIHILTILHQNKGDANARGHLGTELMNKAETVAKLSREETNGTRLTIVEPEFTRHKDFEPFAYSLNDDGSIQNEDAVKGYQPKSPKAEELTHHEITEILKQVYTDSESYSFGKLQDKIYSVCHAGMFESFGKNKCSDLIKRMKTERYISQKPNSVDYINKTPPL
jgi:hypothetical protein